MLIGVGAVVARGSVGTTTPFRGGRDKIGERERYMRQCITTEMTQCCKHTHHYEASHKAPLPTSTHPCYYQLLSTVMTSSYEHRVGCSAAVQKLPLQLQRQQHFWWCISAKRQVRWSLPAPQVIVPLHCVRLRVCSATAASPCGCAPGAG